MTAPAKSALAALRHRIRALETGGVRRVRRLGLPALDEALPGGGFERAALHEVMGAGNDEEDGAVPAAFAAFLAGKLGGTVLWCLGAGDIGAAGVASLGLPPARIVVARARRDEDVLWAVEEALRERSLGAVVGEVSVLPDHAGRRLQLAAEAAGVPVLLLRRWREAGVARRERARPTAAATRWRVGALPSLLAPGEPGVGKPRWRVDLLRCRGGRPASWILEFPDATHPRAFPADAADRPAGARRAFA